MRAVCTTCHHEWEYHYHGKRCQVSGCTCRKYTSKEES